MDIPKKEWDAVCANVNQLTTSMDQLTTSMDQNTKTVDKLETFRQEAEPNIWFIVWLRTIIVGVGLALLAGGCSLIQRFQALETGAGNHQEEYKKTVDRLELQIKEQRAKSDEMFKAHNSLRASVIVVLERQGKGIPNLPETIVYHGRILAVTPGSITILPHELGEPAMKILLTSKTPIRFNKKSVNIDALRVGMEAEVLWLDGDVKSVDAFSKR